MDRESSYLSSFDKKKLNKGEARAAARKRNWGSRIAKYKIIEIIIKSQENFIQERKWKNFFWEGEREGERMEWAAGGFYYKRTRFPRFCIFYPELVNALRICCNCTPISQCLSERGKRRREGGVQ